MKLKYTRILLKLSGEYLGGDKGYGFDYSAFDYLCGQIRKIRALDIEVAIVLGGGNLFRGAADMPSTMNRVTADNIGMLATTMNALFFKEALIERELQPLVMTAFPIGDVAESFQAEKAVQYLKEGKVLIFAGGTGNPYFSTDTAAALRALQIEAEIVVKGTKVDGIYDKDPLADKTARKFDKLSFNEALEKDLKVMDSAAIALCRENKLPLCVLSLSDENDLLDFLKGKDRGTLVVN